MATKEEYPDRISALFTGKCILLTGGTGFMGKVFLEKMLRQCPDIDQFYLLVRTKKGKNPQERLKDVFVNPVSALIFTLLEKLNCNHLDLLCKISSVIRKYL